MKKILLALLVFIYSATNAQQTNGIAVYDAEFYDASFSAYKLFKTFKVAFKGNVYYEKIEYDRKKLDFTKQQMRLENGDIAPPLSPEVASLSNEIMNKTLYAEVLFDFEKGHRVRQEQYNNKYFAVYDTLWQLNELKFTSDTAIIEGLWCQKAITTIETDWEFWFAPSIPTIAGPNGISNFPGLMVLAKSKKQGIRYRLVSLDYPTTQKFKLPYANQKIYSREAYNKMMADIEATRKVGEIMLK
jgi:GLPGLI family protein